MKIKYINEVEYCCKEMEDKMYLNLFYYDDGKLLLNDTHYLKDKIEEISLIYCPFCGKKIEFIDKAKLGYVGDQNAPIKIEDRLYDTHSTTHLCDTVPDPITCTGDNPLYKDSVGGEEEICSPS